MNAAAQGFGDGAAASPKRRRPRKLSELFAQIARDADGPVSMSTIRDALGDRSFAALLVFFAFLNMIPLPPPSSAILGFPMMLVAFQLMYGSKRAWLPRIIMDRSLSSDQFRAIMQRVIPWLVWLEHFIRPRFWPFWRRRGDRVIGTIALLLSLLVVLPIPLGNWPPSFATALLGLALSERDGILFAVGGITALVSLAIITFVIGAAGYATNFLFHWMF